MAATSSAGETSGPGAASAPGSANHACPSHKSTMLPPAGTPRRSARFLLGVPGPPRTRWRSPGQNAVMPDVSIYVAVIAAGAGVLGASIPQVAMFARDARRDERDRRERRAETRRQACLDLLRAGGELRTRLANAAQNHGTEFKAGL